LQSSDAILQKDGELPDARRLETGAALRPGRKDLFH
jgi:hypothetical protein